MAARSKNVYTSIIEKIFESKYKPGASELEFEREDIVRFGKKLKIKIPKNLGDLIYTFRYRAAFPESIKSKAGKGKIWVLRSAGRSRYRFVLIADRPLVPNENLSATKIPDSTPGVIAKYSLSDEQALLARVRYNRLVDIFLGIACYSLQNHLRTTAPGLGQVETDELYVGVDRRGSHYVIPIQAKGGKDRLSIIQIEQDVAVCDSKFPSLICRPVAAQFMKDNVIALFEFEQDASGLGISSEKHYKLVPPDEVSDDDLKLYGTRLEV